MLTGISPLISPSLLKVLSEMGHGDELVLADANFPSESIGAGKPIVRADGIPADRLLEAILPLFPLDQYTDEKFILMQVVPGDEPPAIWERYMSILHRHEPECASARLERFAYYERARRAYAIVASGETATYANIILKKGVVRI